MKNLKYDKSLLLKVILFIVFILFFFIQWLRGYIMTVNYSFNGFIEKIQYEEPKHLPTITVKGKEYDLIYCHWKNYKDTLAVGDSVIKKKGDMDLSLIKRIKIGRKLIYH